MSRPRQAECPQCQHQFLVARDEGDETQCPQCEFGLLVEWFDDEDGESVRLVLPEIVFIPPPNDRLDAVMFAMRCLMEDKMGLPARLAESEPRTSRNDFMEAIIRVTEGTGLNVKAEFTMDCERVHLSINQQAQMMDMRIINNRKRMRKRVRQCRRHWAPPHWTETTGDW